MSIKRTEKTTTVISIEEKKYLQARAQALNLSETEYVRLLIINDRIKNL